MSGTCYCDYGEQPSVYEACMVQRARKAHSCYECGHQISAGEGYERVRALYDGRWDIVRTCSRCLDVRRYVESHAPCFCWQHGSLLDDARDTLREYAHHSAGFWIGGMKRVLRAGRSKPPNVGTKGPGTAQP